MVAMMPDRSLREPAEYVIWGASALLALLVGIGASFAIWAGLRGVAQTGLAHAAVGMLGVGLILIGFSVERPVARLFIVILAAVLVAGYTLGGPAFAQLL